MTIFSKTIFALALGAITALVSAQVPDPQPAPQQQTQPQPAKAAAPGQGSFLGKDLPILNPGTEIATWDGRNWQITNNRIYEARFEKYLNAPEETTEDDRAYQAILRTILDKLAPANITHSSVDEAFRLLPRASSYDVDARLCDALADAVYSAWTAQRAQTRLVAANEALEQERRQHEWNARLAGESRRIEETTRSSGKDSSGKTVTNTVRNTLQLQPYMKRLVEVEAQIKANQAKRELSELQAKIEFQALLVQLFFQRRFQHVLIGTRFYRAIFTTGETALKVGKDTKNLFTKSTGMPPTVGTLDSLANEAIRDVREGVHAYNFLLENNELESATKRLAEAFAVGEFMPEIRTLPREKKRQALDFTQKTRQLVSALEVKDYALAEKIVKGLEQTAKDFDSSKPLAAIETARTVSGMHLAKARNAAVSGDRATLEAELKAATEIWPRNPALAEVSGLIFSQADVQQKALIDFDQLLSQHNYRQIYEDKMRFIAASAMYPERQEQLKKVLDQMQVIESAIMQANEIARRGDAAGAWEAIERAFKQFPEDSKLNQLRANLTTEAADFVRSLRTAEQLETRDQLGSSLAWYLKAQKLYPGSEFAQEGVSRLVKKILPEV